MVPSGGRHFLTHLSSTTTTTGFVANGRGVICASIALDQHACRGTDQTEFQCEQQASSDACSSAQYRLVTRSRRTIVTPRQVSQGAVRSAARRPVIDAAERHRMIQEAAYALHEDGGRIHGHDMDDWIAAEAHVDRMLAQEVEEQAAERVMPDVQQSAGLSKVRDEELKRIMRQHPRRDIANVESVEPAEAPPRE
jgi:hypothetical protein